MPLPLTWWFFALLSAFFAALTTIFAKVGVAGISSNLATAIRTVVILVMAWELSPKTLGFLVLSGLATGLSWLCYFRALQLGPASLVAPIDKSGIVLIVLLSVLFLEEPLTLKVVLGTFLILAGTLVLIR